MTPKTKRFDCVDMKHRGAELVFRDIANLSHDEELKYWRDGTEELRKRQAMIKRRVK